MWNVPIKQVEAIISGIQPGLTMVVGPPSIGKTDTVVQILNVVYHNCPSQRTLIITHSNQAFSAPIWEDNVGRVLYLSSILTCCFVILKFWLFLVVNVLVHGVQWFLSVYYGEWEALVLHLFVRGQALTQG